jgi:hypothetical protein
MQTIVVDGKAYTLITRRFRCGLCKSVAETSDPHPRNFVACLCGAVSIDGGLDPGATVNGNPAAMEDLSVYRAEDGTLYQTRMDVK